MSRQPGLRRHPSMVRLAPHCRRRIARSCCRRLELPGQVSCHLLHVGPRRAVNDGRLTSALGRSQLVHQGLKGSAVSTGRGLSPHRDLKIGPVEALLQDPDIVGEAQRLENVALNAGYRRRRQGKHGDGLQARNGPDGAADLSVLRSKIVSPLAGAVTLIDRNKAQPVMELIGHPFQKVTGKQFLGRQVNQIEFAAQCLFLGVRIQLSRTKVNGRFIAADKTVV